MNIGLLVIHAIEQEMRRQHITAEKMAQRLAKRVPGISAYAIKEALDNGSVDVNALCALMHRGIGTTASCFLQQMFGCRMPIAQAIVRNLAYEVTRLNTTISAVRENVCVNPEVSSEVVDTILEGKADRLDILRHVADELTGEHDVHSRAPALTFALAIAHAEAEVLAHHILCPIG